MANTGSPNIAEDLFKELRTQILSGVLAAGTRLPPERKLAGAFGTNRNTLREAIRRLEQANLVSVRHGQGVTVLDFRSTGTIDILEPFLVHGTDVAEKIQCATDLLAARIRVLEYAMELAIQRATEDDIQRVGRVTATLLSEWENQDRVGLAAAYSDWLDAIVDASHSLPARWSANPLLELNRRLTTHFPAMWVMDDGFPTYIRASFAALSDRDQAAAAAANLAYYTGVDEKLVSMLGWVLQSGVSAFPIAVDGAEGRRQRREARHAVRRRRRLTDELVRVESSEGESVE